MPNQTEHRSRARVRLLQATLALLLVFGLGVLAQGAFAQPTAVPPVRKDLPEPEKPAPEPVELPMARAVGRSVAQVVFRRIEDGRVSNAPPGAMRVQDVMRLLRVQRQARLLEGDVEADARDLVELHHVFRSVRARCEVFSDADTAPVDVVFECEDPLIASIDVVALVGGWWRQAPAEIQYAVKSAVSLGVGDPYNIERVDLDLRTALLAKGEFVDVREERRYSMTGVHLVFRAVQSRVVDKMLCVGSGVELQETLGTINFTDLRFAGRDTVATVRRTLLEKLRKEGYAYASVSHDIVVVPLDASEAALKQEYPWLTKAAIEAALDEDVKRPHRTASTPPLALSIFTVHDGPKVHVAAIHFDGIEALVDVPGSDLLEPGSLPTSGWPLWYALPFSERVDRIKRALYRRMGNGPTFFSPMPAFNQEALAQDADVLQAAFRRAGWLDAEVQFLRTVYNEDRSRVELTYSIRPGPLYVLTAVAIEADTLPAPNNLSGPKVPLVVSLDEIWEAFEYEGRAAGKGIAEASIGDTHSAWRLGAPVPFDEAAISGDPVDPSKAYAQRRIEALFGEKGYSRIAFERTPVFLDPSVKVEGLPKEMQAIPGGVVGVVLQVRINQGHKYRIGTIQFRGNRDTKTSVLRRELRMLPDEPFNIESLRRAADRLRFSQWFERASPGAGVTYTTRPAAAVLDPSHDYLYMDIYIDVVEGRTGAFNASAGYSPGGSFSATLSVSKRNFDPLDWGGFTGAGQFVSFQIEPPVQDRQKYSFTYTEPYLFGYPLSGSLSLSFEEVEFDAFTRGERGGRGSVGYAITRDLDAIFSLQYFENEIKDVDPSASFLIRREEGRSVFAGPSLEFIHNTLNRRVFPSGGRRLSLEYTLAGSAFGGTVDMWRSTFTFNQAMLISQISDDRELALSVRGVAIWQDRYGDTVRVPLAQRQFLGSVNQVTALRGYDRAGVGPSSGGDAIGGNFLVNATAELSLEVQPGFFWFVGFVDVGELVPGIRNFDPEGLSAGIGFGVRIQLPIFPTPFGVDFGWPLRDQPGNRVQLVALNFAVGF